MKRKWRKRCSLFLTILLSAALLSGCGNQAAAADRFAADDMTLTVALFPYVPDIKYFEHVIQTAWDKDTSHSNIKLEFVEDWDCYSDKEIPDNYDVVVFDAIYLTEYVKGGEILSLDEKDIKNYEDIPLFIRDGLKVEESIYSAPEMICANLFFYRPEDIEVAEAGNVDNLYEVMGSYEYSKPEPEKGKGMIVDMSSGTGNICLYLDAIIDNKAVYSDFSVMPDLESIDEAAMQSLNELVLMAGQTGAYYETEGNYDRAKWFGNGSGRAYIGYSESMAEMGDYVSSVKVSTLSLANRDDIPLFYTDVVSLNSSLKDDPQKKKYALDLLNLMVSSEVMTETINRDNNCQYILPARKSCYTALKTKFPIYEQLETIVLKENNHVFRMGENTHDYIERAKKILPYYLLGETDE